MPILGSVVARNTAAFMLAGFIVILAIVITSVWLATRSQDHGQELIAAQRVRGTASALLVSLVDAETGQRGFVITGDKKYLQPYEEAKPKVYDGINSLKSMVTDQADQSTIERLKTVVDRKFQELQKTVDLTINGKRDEAIETVRSDVGREFMDNARAIISDLREHSDAKIRSIVSVLRPEAQTLVWTTILGGGLITLLAGAAFLTLSKHTRQLDEARKTVEELNVGLEARVAERTSDLTRANEEIQRFAYIVSHDLRSPLVNIMGFTAELEASSGTLQKYISGSTDACTEEAARLTVEEELPEAVKFIRASTGKMDQLINAILKLSREGRRELKPENVDLAALFANAAATVQHQLDAAEARIVIPKSFPAIFSDRLALEQIFGNLIDNAVKYLAKDRPGEITISANQKGRDVEVVVRDNGRGIEPKDHERIFELFRRAGAQDKPGEGIGLAHVRALVRRLGGDITVQSELRQGATFLVRLPKKMRNTESFVLA